MKMAHLDKHIGPVVLVTMVSLGRWVLKPCSQKKKFKFVYFPNKKHLNQVISSLVENSRLEIGVR